MKIMWKELRQKISEYVADDEVICVIEYMGEPHIEASLNARTREVEIYGTFTAAEDR